MRESKTKDWEWGNRQCSNISHNCDSHYISNTMRGSRVGRFCMFQLCSHCRVIVRRLQQTWRRLARRHRSCMTLVQSSGVRMNPNSTRSLLWGASHSWGPPLMSMPRYHPSRSNIKGHECIYPEELIMYFLERISWNSHLPRIVATQSEALSEIYVILE